MAPPAELLELLLSAVLGGLIAFGLERYRNRRATRIELFPFGLRLATLAIRARQEVLEQASAQNRPATREPAAKPVRKRRKA